MTDGAMEQIPLLGRAKQQCRLHKGLESEKIPVKGEKREASRR